MQEHGEKARPIAGGTDLLVEKPGGVECLIDLSRLPLSYIESDPGSLDLRIGALTTIREIETSRLFQDKKFQMYQVLSETASQLGYLTTRNLATIGGNICNAVPSADFPPVLIALDSKAKISGSRGERIIPLEELFVDVRRTALRRGELLVEIRIAAQPSRSGTSFQKLGRLHVDIALVNVAVRLTLGFDNTCSDVRIVLGAVASTPIRAKNAEEMLIQKKPKRALMKQAAQAASDEARPITDIRSSSEHRRRICEVLTNRALQQALDRAKR